MTPEVWYLGSSAAIVLTVLGGAWVRHRFEPITTRKYGIVYENLAKSAPAWYGHMRAAWGCRNARVWDKRSKSRGFQRGNVHPLVYVSNDREGVSCHCGGLSGQYVESRDKGTVWFRAIGTDSPPGAGRGPMYTDDDAARDTRREYEAEYAKTEAAEGRPGTWIGPDERGPRRWQRTNEPKMVSPSEWNASGQFVWPTRDEIMAVNEKRVEMGLPMIAYIDCPKCGRRSGMTAEMTTVRCDCGALIATKFTLTSAQTGSEPIGYALSSALGTGSGLGNDTIADPLDNLNAAEDGEWREQQACGCVIYRRLGGESVRVTKGCTGGHASPMVLGDRAFAERVKTGIRAPLALDEEV